MKYKEYCEKYGVYPESDGDFGAPKNHYLAGEVDSPRFTSYAKLKKVILALAKNDTPPSWESIRETANKLDIYTF